MYLDVIMGELRLLCCAVAMKKTILPDETRAAVVLILQAWNSDAPKDLHWALCQLTTLRTAQPFWLDCRPLSSASHCSSVSPAQIAQSVVVL